MADHRPSFRATDVDSAPGTNDPLALEPGAVFAGKYRIERVLGEGGMGIVYAASHLYTHDRVALKFLLPDAATHENVTLRFLNEARAAVQIKSEHVGRVLDVDVLPLGVPYMVMEYLEGSDLSQVLAERGPLPLGLAADFVLQACEALAEAHALGIVHRDLKPSNLFLTRRRDGSALVKVLDFGISKLAPSAGASLQLTKTTAMLGSPLYMSPEQMTNPKGLDARSDVWSLGVVLYELLTAAWPFEGESVQALAVEIVTQPYRPIRQRRPELPEAIETLLSRCLERDPDRRLKSVDELARALAPQASASQSSISVDRVSRVLRRPGAPRPPEPGTPEPERNTRDDALESSVVLPRPKQRRAAVVALAIVGGASALAVGAAVRLTSPTPPAQKGGGLVASPLPAAPSSALLPAAEAETASTATPVEGQELSKIAPAASLAPARPKASSHPAKGAAPSAPARPAAPGASSDFGGR